MNEEERKVDVVLSHTGNIFLETRDYNGEMDALIGLSADSAENLIVRLRQAVIASREMELPTDNKGTQWKDK